MEISELREISRTSLDDIVRDIEATDNIVFAKIGSSSLIRITDEKIEWKMDFKRQIGLIAVIDNNAITATHNETPTRVMKINDGRVLSCFDIKGHIAGFKYDVRTYYFFLRTNHSYDEICAVRGGKVLWAVQLNEVRNFALRDGKIYVSMGDLVTLDATNGKVLDKIPFEKFGAFLEYLQFVDDQLYAVTWTPTTLDSVNQGYHIARVNGGIKYISHLPHAAYSPVTDGMNIFLRTSGPKVLAVTDGRIVADFDAKEKINDISYAAPYLYVAAGNSIVRLQPRRD